MKRTIVVLAVLAVALTFGYAFAAEKEMSPVLYNGVTVFEPAVLATRIAGPEMALENGITIFDTGISSARAEEYGAKGAAAGGLGAKESHRELWNGVTVFSPD